MWGWPSPADGTSPENQSTARYRRFESFTLRHIYDQVSKWTNEAGRNPAHLCVRGFESHPDLHLYLAQYPSLAKGRCL